MFINYIDYYLPDTVITLEEFYAKLSPDFSDRFKSFEEFKDIYKKYASTEEIRIEENFSKKEFFNMLLGKMSLSQGLKSSIKYFIIADDYLNKYGALGHYLLDKHDIPATNVFNVSGNYCCNIEMSLSIAKNILSAANENTSVLILTGNILDNYDDRVVGSYGILSDSCGVLLVSNFKNDDSSIEVTDINIETYRGLYKMNMTDDNTIVHYKNYKNTIENLLNRNHLKLSDVNYIFTHNANNVLIKYVLKSIYKDGPPIFENCHRNLGHLDTVDLILNLKSAIEILPNDRKNFISISIGAPGTYAAIYFKY